MRDSRIIVLDESLPKVSIGTGNAVYKDIEKVRAMEGPCV